MDIVKSRDYVDMTNYVTNGEWFFVGTRIVRNEVRYPIGPAVYPDVTVYVTMRRRILYYMLNIILRCIVSITVPPPVYDKSSTSFEEQFSSIIIPPMLCLILRDII